MRKNIFTLLAIAITTIVLGQTPHVDWAKSFGGKGNDRANSVESDTKGNIFIVGRFQSDTINFGNFILTKNIDDNPDIADIFITKLNKKGTPIWAISSGGKGDDHATSCALDKKGNIYVVGWFESESITFGKIILTTINKEKGKGCNFYVAKFSAKGDCLWAKNAGGKGSSGDYGTVSLDNQSNVIVSGIFTSVMDFGDGVKLTTKEESMYVAKYTAEGKLLWAKSAVGGSESQGCGTDKEGNIFVGGYFFSPTLILDSLTLQKDSTNKSDAFVVKYTPDGKVIWARNFGGEGGEIATLKTDPFGNSILSGPFFSSTIKSNNIELINNGQMNTFVAKYDAHGNILWAKSVGGSAIGSREFNTDHSGNIYVTGSNMSDFTFAKDTVKNIAGSEDVFLLKYDKNGNEKWAIDFGGSNRNAGRGVTIDKKGTIFLTGSFDEQLLKVGNLILSNKGDSDIFLVKLSEK